MASLKPRPRIAKLIQTAVGSMKDVQVALGRGDCGEAVDNLVHAYELRGEAEGYARALREQKGRTGSPHVVYDKRLSELPRLRIRVRRACALPNPLVPPSKNYRSLGTAKRKRR